ncbi:MAG: TVP38/TMEM64 family protein, partial [Spirochaetes bacterium]|nr:TVP38/TMEM64 family protein [Spirochaetota bacterium]
YIFIYAIAVVAAVPGSALTVAAGAMFGSLIGIVCVSVASTLGASLAFLAARYFARDAVTAWLNKTEKFRKLDDMTEKHGAIIVAITRLVPLFPFTWLNYGFGLTKISFKIYVFWSWLCMLPGTVLFVVGADAFTKGVAQGKVPWVLIGVFLVFLIILVFLVRYAKNVLKKKEESDK